MKKTRPYLLRGIAATLVLLLLLVGVALSNARVELTEHGAHRRLLVPFGIGEARFNTFAGTGDKVHIPGFLDGPVVRRKADGNWTAIWFCENQVRQLNGTGDDLAIDCGGKRHVFPVAHTPAVGDAVFDTSADTLVLSDIEGNMRFLDAALQALTVTDAQGNWRYGRHQLVIGAMRSIAAAMYSPCCGGSIRSACRQENPAAPCTSCSVTMNSICCAGIPRAPTVTTCMR